MKYCKVLQYSSKVLKMELRSYKFSRYKCKLFDSTKLTFLEFHQKFQEQYF